MGSCYSCRSNGGPPTYTTVAMAATLPESHPHRGGGGNGSGSSLRGGGSFGFRKRTPVLVKSQFKERTGELVHLEQQQQKKQTTTTAVGAAVVADDARNGNLVSNDANNYSNNRLPCMVKTQLSGLPRPQLPLLLQDKKSVTTTNSPSMRVSPREEEEEEMMMMLEADSGLGNSLSEKKNNEGDTETLAEVDQIEGDNVSIRSKRESPGRTTMTTDEENNKLLQVVVVDNNNHQVKAVPKVSGIARFKYSNPVKSVTVSQLQATKVNLGGGMGEKKVAEKTKEAQVVHNQAKIPRKIPLAVQQLSNRTAQGAAIPAPQVTGSSLAPKVGAKKSTESSISKRGLYYSSPSKVGGGLMKKDELRQKENITPEVVEVVPINLNLGGSKVSESGLKVVGSSYNKSARIESVLPSSINSEPTTALVGGVRNGGGSGRWSAQAKDTPDSSLHDSGPYSPPSEKDFFLIDDEIADQPALINCQQLNGKDLRSYSRSRLSSAHVFTDMNEEGGVPAMAHLQSCLGRSPLTRRRLSHSIDTLSPCSSLASDDLMMDFDRLDETLQSRPLSEVFGDGFQLVPGESKSAEHFLLSKLNSGTGKIPGEADHLTRRSVSSQKTSWILGGGGGGGGGSGSPSPANAPGRSVGSLGAPPAVGARRASEEIEASVDLATYRLLTQDITNVKTLLLRLKRLLQEADHEPHPLAAPKNGLIVHSNAVEESKTNSALEQENADLRRQVVFLQQQLEEKERSIRLLQQQHARSNASDAECREEVSVCNAASQTETQRSTLNSFLTTSSANNDDSLFGSTVSFSRCASSSVAAAARVLDKA